MMKEAFTLDQETMENQIEYELPEGREGKFLRIPGGRLVSFPFLSNCYADGVFINSDAVIESYIFDTPQKIDSDNIVCPKGLGYLSGDILTREIAMSAERQCYLVHLVQPVDINTRFLGIIKIRALELDPSCKFVSFIRANGYQSN
jgi:hypothetical protein